MKIIFQFDTESENFDSTELETYLQAKNMASCISSILGKLRSWYKYDERPSIPTDEIQESIVEIINDSDVNVERMGF